MNTEKTITICGKEVALRYCAATETGFERIADKPISELNYKTQDDLLKLSIAAIIAAAQAKKQEPAVTTEDIIYEATPQEIIALITATLELRNEWYQVPKVVAEAEQPAQAEEGEEKNA